MAKVNRAANVKSSGCDDYKYSNCIFQITSLIRLNCYIRFIKIRDYDHGNSRVCKCLLHTLAERLAVSRFPKISKASASTRSSPFHTEYT